MPKYVNSKAELKCSMGSGQPVLGTALPGHSVSLLCGSMASIMEHKPMINIRPFGNCKSLLNPTVAAATAACNGKLQEMPCIPNTPAPWLNGKMSVLVNGKPALMDTCKCMCVWGGIIKITDAGQKTVSDDDVSAEFEKPVAKEEKPKDAEKKPETVDKTATAAPPPTADIFDKIPVEAIMMAGESAANMINKKDTKTEARETAEESSSPKDEKVYKKGDNGNFVLEINIRLAGFGGLVPDKEFTERTEKGVRQFQRDYMGIEPTGVVDIDTLMAIDEFSEKWCENISYYKCLCHSSSSSVKLNDRCFGYGKGEKNERQGIHRSLLWGISALKYYLCQQTEYKYDYISAGYRCNAHNKVMNRKTTNHMGYAADIHFKYNNGTLSIGRDKIDKLKKIRDDFFIEYLCAVEGWSGQKNLYRLEPIGIGKDESYSWIHIDVVKFEDSYKNDIFFVKEQSLIKGKRLLEINSK